MALSKISRSMRHESGRILQTLEDTTSIGTVDYSSSTFTDIGLSVSITPTYASSKILILYTCPVFCFGSVNALGGGFRLYRDSTVIDDCQGDSGGALGNWINASGLQSTFGYWDYFWTHSGNVMDTPNTTSTINYNVKYSNRQGTTRLGYNGGNNYDPRCRMTVMEIEA